MSIFVLFMTRIKSYCPAMGQSQQVSWSSASRDCAVFCLLCCPVDTRYASVILPLLISSPMRCTSGGSPSQIRVHRTSTELQQTWTDKYRTPNARGTYKTHGYRTTSWDLFCSSSVPSFVHAQNLPPDWSNLTWRGTHFTACHRTTSIQATYANWYERIKNRRLRFSSVDAIRQGVTPLLGTKTWQPQCINKQKKEQQWLPVLILKLLVTTYDALGHF